VISKSVKARNDEDLSHDDKQLICMPYKGPPGHYHLTEPNLSLQLQRHDHLEIRGNCRNFVESSSHDIICDNYYNGKDSRQYERAFLQSTPIVLKETSRNYEWDRGYNSHRTLPDGTGDDNDHRNNIESEYRDSKSKDDNYDSYKSGVTNGSDEDDCRSSYYHSFLKNSSFHHDVMRKHDLLIGTTMNFPVESKFGDEYNKKDQKCFYQENVQCACSPQRPYDRTVNAADNGGENAAEEKIDVNSEAVGYKIIEEKTEKPATMQFVHKIPSIEKGCAHPQDPDNMSTRIRYIEQQVNDTETCIVSSTGGALADLIDKKRRENNSSDEAWLQTEETNKNKESDGQNRYDKKDGCMTKSGKMSSSRIGLEDVASSITFLSLLDEKYECERKADGVKTMASKPIMEAFSGFYGRTITHLVPSCNFSLSQNHLCVDHV